MTTRESRVGDIIEIPTRRGLAYAHLTHIDPVYGPLLRAIRGFFSVGPDISVVATGPTRFHAFTAPAAGVRDGHWRLLGNVAVPGPFRAHPTFRWAPINLRTGQPSSADEPVWWLWDGGDRRFVGALNAEQRQLPEQLLMGPGLFVLNIELDNSEPGPMSAVDAQRLIAQSPSTKPGLVHQLTFQDVEAAKIVATQMRARGYSVDLEPEKSAWKVRATWSGSLTTAEILALQQEAEEVAHLHGGEVEDTAVAPGRTGGSLPASH